MSIFKKTLIVCCAVAFFLIAAPVACMSCAAVGAGVAAGAQKAKQNELNEKLDNRQNVTDAVVEKKSAGPQSSFEDGTFVVGVDIVPGKYRSAPVDQNSVFPMCYWTRLRNFDGGMNSIIANGVTQNGTAIVSVLPGDAGFESKNCKSWTKID